MTMKKKTIIGVSVVACLVVVSIVVVFAFRTTDTTDNQCYYCDYGNQSALGELCSPSEEGRYQQYAISTDSNVCAPAGKDILDEGGNAVDAAIAVLLCMGVTIPESLGLGGGSFIVFYNRTSDSATFINAREHAPGAAYRDMFNSTTIRNNHSTYGIESIGVPGELAGYWHLYNNYGSGVVSWKRLFRDAIKFAKDGFSVGEHLENALAQNEAVIKAHPSLSSVYINPHTNELWRHNEMFRQPTLAKTLENLADVSDPHEYFYNVLAQKILDDIYITLKQEFPEQKAVINLYDFLNYNITEEPAYRWKLKDNITLHSVKLPGSGILLSFIMRTMLGFEDLFSSNATTIDREKAILFYHRLVETYKFAFANRMYLGDERFDNVTNLLANLNSENYIDKIRARINDSTTHPGSSGWYDNKSFMTLDGGTAHMSVLDKHGNAVSATSSINLYFGSKVYSPSTGLILNDQMDDFNTGQTNDFGLPVSHANTIAGDKQPLSSMSPAVFTDDKGVRLAIGASGGPKIFTAIAHASIRHLYFGDSIKQAIDSARLHDQLIPETITYEPCFPDDILDGLRQRNHNLTELPRDVRGAIVMGISRSRDGVIEANSDFRKGGTVAGV